MEVTANDELVSTWSIRTRGGSRKNSCDQVISKGTPRAAAASVIPVPRMARNQRFPHVALKSPTTRRGPGRRALMNRSTRWSMPYHSSKPCRSGATVWTTHNPMVPPGSCSDVLVKKGSPSKYETVAGPSG